MCFHPNDYVTDEERRAFVARTIKSRDVSKGKWATYYQSLLDHARKEWGDKYFPLPVELTDALKVTPPDHVREFA
jgi:hypothetical protein